MAKSRRASLALIFLTVFIDLLGFAIVLPLLPRYAKNLDASGLTVGLLMASFSAMQFVFAPIWGRLSDRIGRRPILLAGLCGSAIFYGMFGYVSANSTDPMGGISTITWLFIARIGAGIAGATIPTAQAYIADITGREERGKGMAIIGAAFGFGFTFGPLIGAAFVTDEATPTLSGGPGYVAAVLSAVAALTAFFVLPESLKKREPGSDEAEMPSSERRGWINLDAFKAAFNFKSIGLVLVTMFMTTFAFAQFETTLPRLTQIKGFSDRDNFYVFAFVGFVLALSQGMIVRRLMPRLREFKMGLIGIVLMTAGLLTVGATAQSQSSVLLYAILPITIVGFSALQPSLQSILSLRSPEDRQGEFLALGQSCSSLARIFGPIAGLSLIDVNSSGPYWLGGGLMGLCSFLLFALRSGSEGDSAAEATTSGTDIDSNKSRTAPTTCRMCGSAVNAGDVSCSTCGEATNNG